MNDLVRYDAMVHAIAECHRVDEVADLHNKALALELYAKQAQNVEAERKATEVRLRAERRAGVLMATLRREPGRRTDLQEPAAAVAEGSAAVAAPSEYAETLERTGIAPRTATRWQQLAKVPEHEFEDALRDPVTKPTTTEILRRVERKDSEREPVRMDADALGVWGRLRDVENITSRRRPGDLVGQMTDPMLADIRRIVPALREWITELESCLDE